MQSGSLIANSFYGSWAHLCHHMQKGEKKSALNFFPSLPHPPKLIPKETVAKVFLAAAKHSAGTEGLPVGWAWQTQGPGGQGARPQGGDGLSSSCTHWALSAPGLGTCAAVQVLAVLAQPPCRCCVWPPGQNLAWCGHHTMLFCCCFRFPVNF